MVRQARERHGLEGSSYWQPVSAQSIFDFGPQHDLKSNHSLVRIASAPDK
jgi:hypothetical protein